MTYLMVAFAILAFLLFINNERLNAENTNLFLNLEEKSSQLALLSALVVNNKDKIENESPSIDKKTSALIKLAVSSSSESEARTAAFEACKRLAKKL